MVVSFIVLLVSLATVTSSSLWVARIEGGPLIASITAKQYGYRIVEKLNLDEDLYVLEIRNQFLQKRTFNAFGTQKRVKWIEEQVPLNRVKRGIFSWLKSRYTREFNDALWDKEWYVQDYRVSEQQPVLDLNTVPCYREGITGKGVRVVVVDDGLEWRHADLRANYDPEISYDLNDDDTDPTPQYDQYETNSHGTKCAGEIAMVANNKICGVGIAYNASIGGIRLLDGNPSDLMEAKALSFASDKVDIYSSSWGPNDDGATMEGPGRILAKVLYNASQKGRNGKGSIFVFSGGNGKFRGDNCGADGYINSIYTIAIASASQEGKAVFYGERCSAILATAYSSGGTRNEQVATTTLNSTCTLRHTGTSAAAPLAAGIIALMLQANPNLTWRDVQHLIVWKAEVGPLASNRGWTLNGFGFWVSNDFGFGLLNAHGLVKAARNFKSVPPKSICIVPISIRGDAQLTIGSRVVVNVATSACVAEINYLEHVELTATISYTRRGALSIIVTSPSNTQSLLLEERFSDLSTSGLSQWTMSSVQFWGENPVGLWTITIRTANDTLGKYQDPFTGSVDRLRLNFHGTKEMPHHYNIPKRKQLQTIFNIDDD